MRFVVAFGIAFGVTYAICWWIDRKSRRKKQTLPFKPLGKIK